MRKLFSILLLIVLSAGLPLSIFAGDFLDEQLEFSRVKKAYDENNDFLRSVFTDNGCSYPPEALFIRIFKKEDILEVWSEDTSGAMVKIKNYDICAKSGLPGPKRREGDFQVPEGLYFISESNPWSSYHLSLKIDYPNESDRILGNKRAPGGLIYIHGSCVTIGCIPIEDDKIEELYIMYILAQDNGCKIPVHIFPSRMTDENMSILYETYPENKAFWVNIREAYDYFEKNKQVPDRLINSKGQYIIQ